jgi:Tfp pilus assembly protein PilF
MIYREPKERPIPVRQFLEAYLIKANKPAEAEKIYKEDLILNLNNGWSFLGLHQSQQQQHKYKEAKEYKGKYLQAFSNADIEPVASVF